MDRERVISSNIFSVGYDENSETLEIEFHDGSIYEYYGVPKSLYESFIGSSSLGSFLHRHLKSYPYQKQN